MRKSSVIYKSLTILSLFAGVLLNIYTSKSGVSVISYYTTQSNIICLISFIIFWYLEIKGKNNLDDIYYLVKGGLVIGIAVTMICYHIALSPTGFDMTSLHRHTLVSKITDFLVHTLSPILVILDYFLFDIKGKFKKFYSLLWLISPLNYVFFVYIYSSAGGEFAAIGGSKKYAYFFLDYEKIGIFGVAKWIIVISFGILMLSHVLIWVDKMLAQNKKR